MSIKLKKSPKGAKQHNPLLVKGDVGKIRPTVYDLPGDDHIYGKAVIRDPLECAATGNSRRIYINEYSDSSLECKSYKQRNYSSFRLYHNE